MPFLWAAAGGMENSDGGTGGAWRGGSREARGKAESQHRVAPLLESQDPGDHRPCSRSNRIKQFSTSDLNKIAGPLRRALIYGLISYGGLVLINNSELELPNMWIAYLPMFIGVYVVTQWLDKRFQG